MTKADKVRYIVDAESSSVNEAIVMDADVAFEEQRQDFSPPFGWRT